MSRAGDDARAAARALHGMRLRDGHVLSAPRALDQVAGALDADSVDDSRVAGAIERLEKAGLIRLTDGGKLVVDKKLDALAARGQI